MNKVIETYYKDAGIMPLLLKKKMAAFAKHTDIAAEFEYWISNKNTLTALALRDIRPRV